MRLISTNRLDQITVFTSQKFCESMYITFLKVWYVNIVKLGTMIEFKGEANLERNISRLSILCDYNDNYF